MKRIQSIFGILATLLVIFSCVPNDPAAIYGLNSNNPNNPNSITGPRIITKIDSANITKTEYVSSNSGILQLVKQYNDADDVITYGNNQKISTITFNEQLPNKTKLSLYYDSTGRVTSSKQENFINNTTLHSTVISTLSYNSNNKLTSVVKKMMFNLISNQFSHYTLVEITYNGENVTKIKDSNGLIVNGVMDPVDPNMITTYTISDFDNKINPMTTLPKEFLIGCGLAGSLAFAQLSYNNFLKTTILPSPTMTPIIHQSSGLNYDPQNYPISDLQNVMKIYYKAIQ